MTTTLNANDLTAVNVSHSTAISNPVIFFSKCSICGGALSDNWRCARCGQCKICKSGFVLTYKQGNKTCNVALPTKILQRCQECLSLNTIESEE